MLQLLGYPVYNSAGPKTYKKLVAEVIENKYLNILCDSTPDILYVDQHSLVICNGVPKAARIIVEKTFLC